MKTITATWQNGQILPDGAADWPEGCRLRIEPLEKPETLGIRDDEWSDSPDAIEKWIQWFNSLEPLEFTPEEQAAWEAERQDQKRFELAQWAKRSTRIEGMFP